MTGPIPFEHPFLRACRREPVDRTPVWLMRQAGRYLPEYRALREKHTFLEMCRTPELAAEVTLQPLRRFDLDAAIVFADILLLLPPMGIELSFGAGEGPVIGNPLRTPADIQALLSPRPEWDLPFLADTIRLTKEELVGKAPLIGFSAAPFTLASYLLEGGGSRGFAATKSLMYAHPEDWHVLLNKLTSALVDYLSYQVDAGVDAIQVFDTWAGILAPSDYHDFVLPYSRRLIEEMGGRVPVIHFATGAATLLELMRRAGGDVIGVDWRIDLGEAWDLLGGDVGVQGNLDPTILLGPPALIEARAAAVLKAAAGRPGHIFNLGHGVLPSTPPEHVQLLVDSVHKLSAVVKGS